MISATDSGRRIWLTSAQLVRAARASGLPVSLWHVQWWDERKVVKAEIFQGHVGGWKGRRRLFDWNTACTFALVAQLRDRGVSLAGCRKLLKALRDFPGAAFLATDRLARRRPVIHNSEDGFLELIKPLKYGVLVVDLKATRAMVETWFRTQQKTLPAARAKTAVTTSMTPTCLRPSAAAHETGSQWPRDRRPASVTK